MFSICSENFDGFKCLLFLLDVFEKRQQIAGAVTDVKPFEGYVFVGHEDGQLSVYNAIDGRKVKLYGSPFARSVDALCVFAKISNNIYGVALSEGLLWMLEFSLHSDPYHLSYCSYV